MSPRARRVLVIAVVLIAFTAAAIGAAAWYLLGEERRAGRLIAALLSERTGVPITVERAHVESSRVRLRGVHVPPGPAFPVDVRAREVEIDGGTLPFFAPAGRRISVVAISTSISVPPGGTPANGESLEALRRPLRALLDWPALLSFRIDDGRLETGGRTYRVELTADKTASALTLAGVITPPSEPSALRLEARAAAVGDADVRLGLDLSAKPRRLPLWPLIVAPPAAVALKGDVTLGGAGRSLADGRLIVGEPAAPTVIDFAAHYEPVAAVLVVPRCVVQSGTAIRLEGSGELRAAEAGVRARLTAQGVVDGSRLDGTATWELTGIGRFGGQLTMANVDGARLARRVGLEPPPVSVTARTLVSRFSGEWRGQQPRASVDLKLNRVATAALPQLVTDWTVSAAFGLAHGEARVTRLESSTLTLTRDGRHLGIVTAASRPGGLWPIDLLARLDDLAVLGGIPLAPALAGSARLTGELNAREAPEFRGALDAEIASASVVLGTPATVTGAWAAVPVAWGVPPAARPGSISVARLAAWGLALEHLTTTAWLTDGQLLLPDLRYVHYGGEGTGWLEARLDADPALLRVRLDGKDVDLARLSREVGVNVGRITGAARYVANAQYTVASGLAATARLESGQDGGEVNIDAIQRLLDSATVQAENNAVLQQTLRNLRTFRYDKLVSELRYSGGAGRMDVSLRGKKRLGIFPAPVEAINIHNVPLAVLARAFARDRTP